MTATLSPSSGQLTLPLSSSQERRDFASKLRQSTIAVRVRRERLGVRRALSKEQLKIAASGFDAEASAISAAKKLFDTKDPSWRAVIVVISRAVAYWKSVSTPYPEKGVRLIRKDAVDQFNQMMEKFKVELMDAAANLQANYEELRNRAKDHLGDLFNPGDYPSRVDSQFALEWDFPSIEPPAYLKDLHPHLYEQECDRIRVRFEEAVRLSEEAFAARLQSLVAHLADRLSGDVDGKPKVLKDSAVQNLKEFFDEFKQLDIGSSGELQQLINQAQKVLDGVSVNDLRDGGNARVRVADGLQGISQALDGMMVNKPRREMHLEDE